MGLEAPQQAVCDFLAGRAELLDSFTEIESGRKNDRPELVTALDACRRQKALDVIAKLDRLGQNVYFISGLMESGMKFVAVDMPKPVADRHDTMGGVWGQDWHTPCDSRNDRNSG